MKSMGSCWENLTKQLGLKGLTFTKSFDIIWNVTLFFITDKPRDIANVFKFLICLKR